MRNKLLNGIILLLVSIFLIILGIGLTITLVFSFIGIPLIIIGAFLTLFSIIIMISGTLNDLLSSLKRLFKRKKEDFIDLKEKDGVYMAKK